MPKATSEELFAEFSEAFELLWNILEEKTDHIGNLSVQERKLISETAIFLHEMLEHVELDKIEMEFAQSWLQHFGHVLGREFEGNFILRFYYFAENYPKDPARTVHSMISLVVALRALELCGFNITRGGTVWNYIERDMSAFREELSRILNKDDTLPVDELFLLLNVIDFLANVKDSEILGKELQELIHIAENSQSLFEQAFDVSPGLKVYVIDLVNRVGLQLIVDDLPNNLSGKPRAFLTLMELRKGDFPSLDQLEQIHHPSTMHLWWIAKAWKRRYDKEDFIGILPFYSRIDVDTVFRSVWGNSKDLNEIQITEENIAYTLGLTGQEIKEQLYQYFKAHPQVTEFSQTRLSEERDKADSGGEIADFNVEIKTGRGDIWMAIPIKSGREVGGRQRDKVEQNYFYQFIRPLVMFETGRTVVFPIVLVKPTLNTNEFISLVRARLQLPILILDIELYTRFLKMENLLPPNGA